MQIPGSPSALLELGSAETRTRIKGVQACSVMWWPRGAHEPQDGEVSSIRMRRKQPREFAEPLSQAWLASWSRRPGRLKSHPPTSEQQGNSAVGQQPNTRPVLVAVAAPLQGRRALEALSGLAYQTPSVGWGHYAPLLFRPGASVNRAVTQRGPLHRKRQLGLSWPMTR